MVLLIRDSDVRLILDFKEAIEAVEACFKEYAKGMVWLPQRLSLNLNKFEGWFSVMPTYLLESNVLTVKLVSSYPKNIFQGLPLQGLESSEKRFEPVSRFRNQEFVNPVHIALYHFQNKEAC